MRVIFTFLVVEQVRRASTCNDGGASSSPLLHTAHYNQLTVSNDGATAAAVLAYLLSYVSTVSCCEGVSSMRRENEHFFEPADGSFGQTAESIRFPIAVELPDSFYVADHMFHAAAMSLGWHPTRFWRFSLFGT